MKIPINYKSRENFWDLYLVCPASRLSFLTISNLKQFEWIDENRTTTLILLGLHGQSGSFTSFTVTRILGHIQLIACHCDTWNNYPNPMQKLR